MQIVFLIKFEDMYLPRRRTYDFEIDIVSGTVDMVVFINLLSPAALRTKYDGRN